MKKNAIKLALAGCAMAWVMYGCNVFEPLASKSSSDYQTLLVQGNKALNAGDYQTALNYYGKAMKKNPKGSEAYLFHAQALIALYKIDYNRINDEFKKADSVKGLPFLDANSTISNTDSLYFPVATAVRDLEHILRGRDTLWLDEDSSQFLAPDGDTASDGRITPSVARLDLGILSAVKALLAPIDLDGDLHVDSVCGDSLTPAQKAQICLKGDTSEVDRLNSMVRLTADVSFDTLDSKSVNGKELSNLPTDINAYIESMLGPLASAAYNLDSVRSSLQSHNQTSLSNDIAKTVTRVRDMSNFVGYMQYNDNVDDDYDRQLGKSDSVMRWHDFDRDHGIRYNYDDNSTDPDTIYTKQGAQKINYGDPGNIGHPLHRYRHPELYKTYKELETAYPKLEKDTSQNSRINLMKKGCKSLVDTLSHNPYLDARLTPTMSAQVKAVCDSISPVLKDAVSRPSRSDWVGGTPGIDEELLDGFDNDYDGITDEDSRNLQGNATQGFDDDNDAPLSKSMIGQPVTPMQWKDNNGNGCIDIDPVARPTVAGDSSTREFCVGTLEHRLHLARVANLVITNPEANLKEDSLQVYYTRGVETETDCIRQYNRYLDPAFRAKFKPTDKERDAACHFKDIWIAPIPPRSEWTGGVFGEDEEICGDLIDNDGDGWVDEDCGDHQ